jgi:hypothetical protein
MKMTMHQNKKHGIALIVVLGFLAILVVMGVTLLTTTRVERLVSRAAVDAASARQLAQSAVFAAMDEVNDILWPAGAGASQVFLHPDRDVTVSDARSWAPDRDGAVLDAGFINGLFMEDALLWLPERYHNVLPPVRWVLIRDPRPDANGDYPILGRYAYMAFDCTGMLNANTVDRGGSRSNGVSIGQVQLDNPPLQEIDSDTAFRFNRDMYTRFDTFGELNLLNDGLGAVQYTIPSNEQSAINGYVENLCPYTLSYDRGWWDWSATPMEWTMDTIAGAPLNVTNWTQTDAQNVFSALGYANANDMGLCFEDYVDSDFIPANVNIPACEPVPMINEVTGRLRLELDTSTDELTFSIILAIELWYPFFDAANTETYTMALPSINAPTMSRYVNPSPTPLSYPAPGPNSGSAVPTTVSPANFTVANFSDGFLMVTARYDFVAQQAVEPTNLPVNLRSEIRTFEIELRAGATPVDYMNMNDPNRRMQFAQLNLNSGDTQAESPIVCMAVNDPRLNHELDFGNPPGGYNWDTASPTPMALNYPWGNNDFGISWSVAHGDGNLEGTNMYVRNAPMQNVGELGFIPTGERWATIDLFSPEGRELLTKFRDASMPTNFPTTELYYSNIWVNPSSTYTSVLEAVFLDTPIEEYPGQPGARRLDADMAEDIAISMIEQTLDNAPGPNAFDSRAAWVTTGVFAVDGTLSAPAGHDLNNMQKEGIIRNSYRMFNPSGNLLTFLVVAQTIRDDENIGQWDGEDVDIITGERRLMALVWRDAFPNDNDRHETFIRRMQWLDE